MDQVRTLLADTPRCIEALTASFAPVHFRACADKGGSDRTGIDTQDKPIHQSINSQRGINTTNYPGQKFCRSLPADLLSCLNSLVGRDWSRPATAMKSP